jgi:recombination protein RecA
MRRIDQFKQGTQIIGGRHSVKVAKNKVATPFRVAEFDLMYAEGISKEGGLLDLGLQMGLSRPNSLARQKPCKTP